MPTVIQYEEFRDYPLWDEMPDMRMGINEHGKPVNRISGKVDGVDVTITQHHGDEKMMVTIGGHTVLLVAPDDVLRTIVIEVSNVKTADAP